MHTYAFSTSLALFPVGAYNLNFPITFTDAQEELTLIKFDLKEKLTLENGMVMLPNPVTLKEDWIEATFNLPDTLFENVKNYLDINKAGKAFKRRKKLTRIGTCIERRDSYD